MNKDKITEAILLCTIVSISCVFYVYQDGKYGHNSFQLEKIQNVFTFTNVGNSHYISKDCLYDFGNFFSYSLCLFMKYLQLKE